MSQVVCKSGERIRIGGNIEIVVVRTEPDLVEMAIYLPPGVAICKQNARSQLGQRSLETFAAPHARDESPYIVESN